MSYKKFRDEYPKEIVDEIYLRYDSTQRYVYRAIEHSEEINSSDFVPTFISELNSDNFVPKFLFTPALTFGKCSMSVFTDLEKLKNVVNSSKNVLMQRITGYAFGSTNSEKGVWTAPNSKSHIDYFLFDWENNNPSGDFEICEKR